MVKPRLLIVDDEVLVCRSLARALRRTVDVSTAENASQARELLAAHTFDVILSDLNMPGENGLQLLASVAAQYPLVRRVLMTGGEPELNDTPHGPDLIHATLTKPFDLDHAAVVLGLHAMKLATMPALHGAVVSNVAKLPVAEAVIHEAPGHSDLRGLILWQQALLEMPLKHVVLVIIEPKAALGFSKAAAIGRWFEPVRGAAGENRLALAMVSPSWVERLAVTLTSALSPRWPVRTFTPTELPDAMRWLHSMVPAAPGA